MVLDSPQSPPPEPHPDREQGGFTEAEKRSTFIRLVFDGDEQRYDAFRQAIAEAVPPSTRAIVRGSAVTGPLEGPGAVRR